MKRTQLIIPIESMPPRSLLEWLLTSILPTTLPTAIALSSPEVQENLEEEAQNSISDEFKSLFLKSYRFDGYNVITNTITSADGTVSQYQSLNLPWWIVITSFLGLPNRPSTVINGEPQFSLLQLLRNFIGGWNSMGLFHSKNADKKGDSGLLSHALPVKKLSTEKKIWQLIALPVKFLLILPIKIISIPFKIFLNLVKLVTEILFPIISSFFLIISLIPTGLTLSLSEWTWERPRRRFLTVIPIVLLATISIALIIVQYATIWVSRIGFAFTSPAESARQAFALGRTLRMGTEGSTFQRTISNIVGGLGVVASLVLSAVLWSIALPFALSALTTLFPFILTAINWIAQVPFISNSLAWISQLTVVTSSLTLFNQLFSTVGAGLSTFFGPAITAMASIFSVQVSSVVLAVGTTLGMLCTPIVALMSLGADTLSNLWTGTTSGPVGKLIGLFQKSRNPSDYIFNKTKDTLHLYEYIQAERTYFVVSPIALDLVSKNNHLSKTTEYNGDTAERFFNDIKADPQKQWREGRFRFPTKAELGEVSESPDFQYDPLFSNDLL